MVSRERGLYGLKAINVELCLNKPETSKHYQYGPGVDMHILHMGQSTKGYFCLQEPSSAKHIQVYQPLSYYQELARC